MADNVAQQIDVEEEVPVKSVTITSPCDSILNPAKLSKIGAGSAVPSSCEPILGSSPDLPHKDTRGNYSLDTSLTQQGLGDDKVEEVCSQYGSSISPSLSSKSETADLEPFSDAG